MSQGDLDSERFHTRPAVLGDGPQVTVGLVGLHIYQRVERFDQGVWATFGHIDNNPSSGTHSFFNPSCSGCATNVPTQPPTPTQVVRISPLDAPTRNVNVYAQQLIRSADQNNPFQYYELLGVQWPTNQCHTPCIGIPSQKTTQVPEGSPTPATLVNPVIETFLQTPNTSCIGCHKVASDAKGGSYATSFSFLLGHAK
jgi:hypothetical protein